MLHEPAAPSGKDPASGFKKQLGVRMFFVYALVYAGFVAINLIDAKLMEREVLLGMNLAVVYGVGLIIFALVQALVYNAICTRKEIELEAQSKDGSEEPEGGEQ